MLRPSHGRFDRCHSINNDLMWLFFSWFTACQYPARWTRPCQNIRSWSCLWLFEEKAPCQRVSTTVLNEITEIGARFLRRLCIKEEYFLVCFRWSYYIRISLLHNFYSCIIMRRTFCRKKKTFFRVVISRRNWEIFKRWRPHCAGYM